LDSKKLWHRSRLAARGVPRKLWHCSALLGAVPRKLWHCSAALLGGSARSALGSSALAARFPENSGTARRKLWHCSAALLGRSAALLGAGGSQNTLALLGGHCSAGGSALGRSAGTLGRHCSAARRLGGSARRGTARGSAHCAGTAA
jgi:hypothetical protein